MFLLVVAVISPLLFAPFQVDDRPLENEDEDDIEYVECKFFSVHFLFTRAISTFCISVLIITVFLLTSLRSPYPSTAAAGISNGGGFKGKCSPFLLHSLFSLLSEIMVCVYVFDTVHTHTHLVIITQLFVHHHHHRRLIFTLIG